MKPRGALCFCPRLEALETRWLPASYTNTPVIPTIDAAEAFHLSQVIQRGQQLGNRLNVFVRAGDSITISNNFLTPLATPSAGVDLAGDGSLEDTLNFFRSGIIGTQNSFSRTSTAALGGWTSANVLANLPGELAIAKPAFVLIMAGTNDTVAGVSLDVYKQNLTAIVQTALNAGVVPVLSTIPDILLTPALEQRQPDINQTIEDVGEAMQVPVWNFWRALQPLPALGISSDLVHPSVAPTGGGDFTPLGLQFGYNVRNLTALQTLDKLKRIVLQGATPDLPGDNNGWVPLTHALPVAAGDTTGFQVQVLDVATRQALFSFDPYPGYHGTVHVTTGDINGDHIPDLITTVGPGGPPHVKVFDGATGALLESFLAFDATMTSGLSVAAADVNGDGLADVIVCPEANGPAHIKVFSAGNQLMDSFYAFPPSFLGGATVAAGDTNGDGKAEIMVAAGRGGNGHIVVFAGPNLNMVSSFLPFGPGYASDVSLAAGDFDGDGLAELAVGVGTGGPPWVTVFRPLTQTAVAGFYAYAPGYLDGVKLAVVNRGNGPSALVTASSGAGFADLRLYNGMSGVLLDAFPLYEVGLRQGVSFAK
jgi:hypothetical protein